MNITPTDNSIFKDAIVGVLLVITAVANFIVNAAALQLPLLVLPVTLAAAGTYLLYRAVKHDKMRLKQGL